MDYSSRQRPLLLEMPALSGVEGTGVRRIKSTIYTLIRRPQIAADRIGKG
jgi:hypothetical protein